MAYQYIEYVYPIEYQFEKMLVWLDSTARIYFALKREENDSWNYYAGEADHTLATGSRLVGYGTSESNAQTNYWRPTPDSNNKIIGVLGSIVTARYVRIYIDDANDAPTTLYEFRPSIRILSDEIITGNLEITDDFSSPPKIVVTSGGVTRLVIGNTHSTYYGIVGYDDSSATIFEITDNRTYISGFDALKSGLQTGGIFLNASDNIIAINSATFGNEGIQLDYNSGNPRAYIGDGSNQYFMYDGTNVSWKGTNTELTTSGSLNVSNLQADGGKIAGWTITSTVLKSSTGNSRIELNQSKSRISVFDSAGTEKTVMGYLEGLTKNASPSDTWGSADYGFYAAPGDHLTIDGNASYVSGDWIVNNDAALKIYNGSNQEILRLGTDSGKKGLFLYTVAGTTLAEYHNNGFKIGDTGGSDNYIEYSKSTGELTIKGSLTVTGSDIGDGEIHANHLAADSVAASHIQANAVKADNIDVVKLSAISANVGSVLAGYIESVDVVGANIKTKSSGRSVQITSDGISLHVTATVGKYGTFKYGTKKYGSGALAYIHHSSSKVPFYISAEQTVADFHFFNRSSDPVGTAAVGDVVVVNGVMRICTTGGTPGVWATIGQQ